MKINLNKRRKEKGFRIFNMKYLDLCSSTPKINKDNKNKSLLNDSNLILDDNKQASIQLNSDQNFFYRNNNSKKEESDKENESIKYSQKFFIKKGILIKNSTISKTNSQYGSFMKNSQNKLSPYKALKINLHKGLNNLKKFSPINNIKKIKWNQYGILNLSKKTFKKKK